MRRLTVVLTRLIIHTYSYEQDPKSLLLAPSIAILIRTNRFYAPASVFYGAKDSIQDK